MTAPERLDIMTLMARLLNSIVTTCSRVEC